MKQQMLEEEVRNLKKTIEALTAELDQLYEGLNAWPRSLALATLARAEAAESELIAMMAERDQAIDDAKNETLWNAHYVYLVEQYRNERDALTAQNLRLREALTEIEGSASPDHWSPQHQHCVDTARATLKGEQK